MDDAQDNDLFAPVVRALAQKQIQRLERQLREQSGLSRSERQVIRAAAIASMHKCAERKLTRLLLLELHAAKLEGKLAGNGEQAMFADFVRQAVAPGFPEHLRRRYPTLERRLDRTLRQYGAAVASMVARFVDDRGLLAALPGSSEGELAVLQLGEGDVHNGGQAVATLRLSGGGSVMYKPRSLAADRMLDGLLEEILPDTPDRIRVPAVLERGKYGWAEFVEHRYCEDERELAQFYRGLGHWLAVMRLLGGTDLHHENLIAAGPVPVAIDVESLFARELPASASGRGEAVDLAGELIRRSVLRTGLVPFRAPALGLSGVDISAAGALPGEQPQIRVPVIVDGGSTEARMDFVELDLPPARNHPCANPDISRYWDRIVSGFSELTGRLVRLDRDGLLQQLLSRFVGVEIRDICRPTQAYVEIMRMLWHPASLHDEPAAIDRAKDLLRRNAEVVPIAPGEPEKIAAEVEDLLYGDVPVFHDVVTQARLDETVRDWRAMRIELEELTVRGALVTAYLNGRLNEDRNIEQDIDARCPHAGRLEERRRTLAADFLGQLLRLSVRGSDGTVTWVSPVLGDAGWAMRSLQSDMYVGLGGIAMALAGYLHEVRHGRADQVEGAAESLQGVLRVLEASEGDDPPRSSGGYMGLGSQIVTWLTLHGLQPKGGWLQRAVGRGALLERRGFDEEPVLDLLEGVAGAVVPLLQLAEATGQQRWLDLAVRAGRRLEATAVVDARGARWPTPIFTEPLGGFAHGATGVGWALLRLSMSEAGSASERGRWAALAARAFDFEDSLYHAEANNWIDIRKPASLDFPNTWCHGSVGIGLAACDLYARTGEDRHLQTLRRAATAARGGGWAISHTLCHGDLSLWEMLHRASLLAPELADPGALPDGARIISSMEEHKGAVGGLARDAFTPGLMSGLSGAIHWLNRVHPECRLPSPLLLEYAAEPVAPSPIATAAQSRATVEA